MQLQHEWYQKETHDNTEEAFHRLPDEEMAFYRAVTSGDMEAVCQNCRQMRFADMGGAGVLSRDPVQNLKYHFVVAAAVMARMCIGAGLELERAFRLSDFYIQKLDSIHNAHSIVALHTRMALDFTEKMRLLRKSNGISRPISACVDYIYVHITHRLTVENLADHTGLSPSYLSRLFKQEMGICISDYIRQKKVEKAKNLLRYTDSSLIDIANYLSFSSQSHFIQTFKRVTNMTPKKYRDQNYSFHLNWEEGK